MSKPRPALGAPDGNGRYGYLDHDHDDDGRVLCHECGRWWRHLATHIFQSHGIRADDYREAHGLPQTLALVGTSTHQAMSAGWERNRPIHVAALDEARDTALATNASRTRNGRPWAAATIAGRQAAAASRRTELTPDQVASLGDPTDLPAWCAAARALIDREGVTGAAISRAAGLSTATVWQRLRRYPPP